MTHLHRFYIPEAVVPGAEAALNQEDAHHAHKVLRLQPGEAVELLDGRGRIMQGKIAASEKRAVSVAVEAVQETPQPTPEITLAVGWLHQDKAIEFIIRNGTALGVSAFCFFRAMRSQRPIKHSPNPKWEKYAIESCKQCGRAWLPRFEMKDALAEVIQDHGGPLLIASLDEPPTPLSHFRDAKACTVLIGPEGDFAPDELEQARTAGAAPVSLGDAVFRSELAAIVAAAILRYKGGDKVMCGDA